MGSSTQTTNSSSSSQPDFAPQVGALNTAFNSANTALTQAQGAQAPTNYTAGFTPDQLATFQQMLGYTNSNGTPTSQANTGSALSSAGTNATTGALDGLGNFNASSTNNPSSLVDAANQYVAGQNIPAQVQAAMQSADEQAQDVTMPGIEQDVTMTGNTNSSRTGIADGLVQRSLAEQAANMSGSMQGTAFANGLNLAENQANQNNTTNLGALSDAANAGTNAANSGVNVGTSSINNQGQLYSLAENAGQGQQAANQADLTNQQQQYQAQTNDPFAALNNYYNIVGSTNWGSSTSGTQTATSSPSAWSVIGGLLGGVGSAANAAGSLGWQPFASKPTYATGAAGDYVYPQFN